MHLLRYQLCRLGVHERWYKDPPLEGGVLEPPQGMVGSPQGRASTVVAGEHDHGVVQDAEGFERVVKPAHLVWSTVVTTIMERKKHTRRKQSAYAYI